MVSGNDMNDNQNSGDDGGDGGFDLNDLKSAMARATPRPDATAKAAHITLAQLNFDNLHAARQGSAAAPRLNPERPKAGVYSGVRNMLNALSTKGGLTVTTAIVACGFLVLTPQGKDLLTRIPGIGGGTVTELDVTVPATGGIGETPVVPSPTGARVGATEGGEILEERADDLAPVGTVEVEIARDRSTDAAPEPGIVSSGEVPSGYADDSAENSSEVAGRVAAPVEAPAPADTVVADRRETDADGFAAEIVEMPAVVVDPAVPQSPQSLQQAAPQSGTVIASAPSPTGPALGGLAADGVFATEQAAISGEIAMQEQLPDTEAFANEAPNPVHITAQEPVSTFSIDVDTAAYSVVRQSLNAGYLPPRDAVRVEELINYFPYDYAAPEAGSVAPFLPTITVMQTPWNDGTQLVHIGLQGVMPAIEDRPPLNLVFLIDTSGSMAGANKLPLLRQSFLLMLDELRPEDEVAIVEYAGSAGIALAPTPASNRAAIALALMRLGAGGSTNGQGGLEQAYATAEMMTGDGEVSRVILATDGDFNVGLSGIDELEEFISKKRDTGTYLSVLGFGRGNLDDATMQVLAQNGNGVAAYIDTLNEAQKVLVDQLTGALFAIAGDVKVQVEFNPAVIAEYRLIGYETRALEREDFNNDAVDAGELGAGHSVTAIYEVTPVGSDAVLNDPLRYAPAAGDAAIDSATETAETAPEADALLSEEIGFLRLRWKAPGEDVSQLIETPIYAGVTQSPGTEAQFATAIAGFGQLLRGDSYLGADSENGWGWDEAIALANASRGEDPFGYRTEAVQLMRLAESLSQN